MATTSSFTSLGVGSGLDLEGIITKLMSVEQQPLLALQKRETAYNAKISALGSLKSTLASLQTAAGGLTPAIGKSAADKFASFSAGVADSSLANATASTGAVAGNYTLSNIELAGAQQIRRTAIALPSAAGALTIQVGAGDPVTANIAANATLADVVSAINNSSTAVSASIINDGAADHLILTAKDTGAANTIKISGQDGWSGALDYSGAGSSGDWTESSAAKNASLQINGIAVTSASNTLKTAIQGVTLNLTKAGSTTLSVSKDVTAGLSNALNAFISAYNAANTSMSALGAYNPVTKAAGALQGNSTLRSAQNQVRSVLFDTVAGGSSAYQRLSDIGVAVAKDGSLSLDAAKLNKAIAADYNGVANLVAKVGGAYNTTLANIVGASGSLVAATDSATSMLKSLQNRENALSSRLNIIEANYRKQFTALDKMIAGMNKTSSYLTQQLSMLSRMNGNSNN